MATTHLDHRNRRIARYAVGFALAMLGLGYASVPLYRMFCQATGFGGTTRQVTQAQADEVKVSAATMSIRFDGNVERGMPWLFHPQMVTDTVQLGERRIAIYRARNTSNEAITGRASYNVEPEQAGRYFNKVQCFCFTEQTLLPGQEVSMPVVYFVDPAISKDPDVNDVQQITLSYTFHRVHAASAASSPLQPVGAKPLDRPATGG